MSNITGSPRVRTKEEITRVIEDVNIQLARITIQICRLLKKEKRGKAYIKELERQRSEATK